jgi:hypothetical protein
MAMFYGTATFVFTLFAIETDAHSITSWLKGIGQTNAGYLRTVKIIYRAKGVGHYIKKTLLPNMKDLGVKIENGIVEMKQFKYPYCYCEHCVMSVARGEDAPHERKAPVVAKTE